MLRVRTMCLRVCDTTILYLTSFFLVFFIYSCVFVFISSVLGDTINRFSVMCLCLPHELGSGRRKVNTGQFRFYPPIPLPSLPSILKAGRVTFPSMFLCFFFEYTVLPIILRSFSLRRDLNAQSGESRSDQVNNRTTGPPCSAGK